MTARLVSLQELIEPYIVERVPVLRPYVSLTARLAMLEADCHDLRADLNQLIENPCGISVEGDDYRHDEDPA